MKIFNYTLILFLTLGMLSCSSSSSSDDIAPTVKFTSPSTDAANPTKITSGQIVTFKGTVSDNKEMKSITITDLVKKTKSVDDFILDFNTKLGTKKPASGIVLDKSTYDVNFTIETKPGAPAQEYTMTCKVIDSSDIPTEVKFYIKVD